MTPKEMIRSNAEMAVKQLGEVSGIESFGYNAESVEWLDGFIERQRVRPECDEAFAEAFTSTLGSYLGECAIACFGGEWRQQGGSWAVGFSDENAAFPFNKVAKQFANGSEDSVLGWFACIPALFQNR